MQRDARSVRMMDVSVLAGQSSPLFSYKGLTPNILFGFCCGTKKHTNPIVSQKVLPDKKEVNLGDSLASQSQIIYNCIALKERAEKQANALFCEKENNEICI